MIDLSFLTFSILESLKIDNKYANYFSIAYNVVAIGLWFILGSEEKYIPIILGVILVIKSLFDVKTPINLKKFFLPLTLITLAPIEKSIIFSLLVIVINKRESIYKEFYNIAGITFIFILSLLAIKAPVLISYIGLAVCGLYIIFNYQMNNRYSLLLWVLIQSKFSVSIFSHKLYYLSEIVIVLIMCIATFLLWLEKRRDTTWLNMKKVQILFIWFATIQFGPFGFWLSLSFYSFIKETLLIENGPESSAVIKIKPVAIAVFYLLPVSLPMFFLINTKDTSSTVLGGIAAFLYLMIGGRWMREMKISINEKIMDKWHVLDVFSIMSVTVYLSYRLLEGNLLGVITYSAISVVMIILFMGLRVDDYLFNKLSMPRVLLVTGKKQTFRPSQINIKLNQTQIANNLINFIIVVLKDFFEFIERNFLVVFMLVFGLIFFIGGGFA